MQSPAVHGIFIEVRADFKDIGNHRQTPKDVILMNIDPLGGKVIYYTKSESAHPDSVVSISFDAIKGVTPSPLNIEEFTLRFMGEGIYKGRVLEIPHVLTGAGGKHGFERDLLVLLFSSIGHAIEQKRTDSLCRVKPKDIVDLFLQRYWKYPVSRSLVDTIVKKKAKGFLKGDVDRRVVLTPYGVLVFKDKLMSVPVHVLPLLGTDLRKDSDRAINFVVTPSYSSDQCSRWGTSQYELKLKFASTAQRDDFIKYMASAATALAQQQIVKPEELLRSANAGGVAPHPANAAKPVVAVKPIQLTQPAATPAATTGPVSHILPSSKPNVAVTTGRAVGATGGDSLRERRNKRMSVAHSNTPTYAPAPTPAPAALSEEDDLPPPPPPEDDEPAPTPAAAAPSTQPGPAHHASLAPTQQAYVPSNPFAAPVAVASSPKLSTRTFKAPAAAAVAKPAAVTPIPIPAKAPAAVSSPAPVSLPPAPVKSSSPDPVAVALPPAPVNAVAPVVTSLPPAPADDDFDEDAPPPVKSKRKFKAPAGAAVAAAAAPAAAVPVPAPKPTPVVAPLTPAAAAPIAIAPAQAAAPTMSLPPAPTPTRESLPRSVSPPPLSMPIAPKPVPSPKPTVSKPSTPTPVKPASPAPVPVKAKSIPSPVSVPCPPGCSYSATLELMLDMPEGPVMFGTVDAHVTLPFLSSRSQQVFAIRPSDECGLAPSQLISTNGLLLDVKPDDQVDPTADLVLVTTQPHQDLSVCGHVYSRANTKTAFCLLGALPGSEAELEHYSPSEPESAVGAGTELYVFLGTDDLSIGLITLESGDTTFAELRERILDELDDLPAQFCFLFNGAKMGLKQEAKRRVSELPDNRVAIKSVKRKRPVTAATDAPAPATVTAAPVTGFAAPPPCPIVDFNAPALIPASTPASTPASAPTTAAPETPMRRPMISAASLTQSILKPVKPSSTPASPAGGDLLNAIRGFQGRGGLRKVDEEEVKRSRQEASERMQTQGLGGMFVSLKHTLASRRVAMEEEQSDSADEWSD